MMATRLPTTPKMNITAGMVTGLFSLSEAEEKDALTPGVDMLVVSILFTALELTVRSGDGERQERER